MVQKKEQYLKILKLELTNLIDDISNLITYEKELHDKNKHTNFVYLENLVVLKDEIMGINGILGEIDRVTDQLSSDYFENELKELIKEFINKRGYPLAVSELFNRKIRKINDLKGLM